MSETCPKTGMRCIPGLCRNYETMGDIYKQLDLVTALLMQQAKNHGRVTKSEINAYIFTHPDYLNAAHEAQEALRGLPIILCTPLANEPCMS